ncbi:PREDICTED: zinc finger SWIM domain-containing protein 7-like [Papilio xuthus]|uniref:Zinc finger SWIM domain-containing protein 7-like n=1 Tax=Papilio xuthus TaxID=66420 RepID=A0AAJ6Z9Q6_PAPXU|nr:PREDICTED: zinc finger SWIM domain-containing protein 7-like [Papilio xuthus]
MTDCTQSKLPSIVEKVLNQIEERVHKTTNKQITDEDLLTLHSIFGGVLQRALDIIEKYPTFVTYSTANKTRELIEIKGENDRCYRVFPRINFCPCLAFKHQVLEKKTQISCKHILAARIQQILGKTVNHDVTHDQYLMLVKSMFDLEDENNG